MLERVRIFHYAFIYFLVNAFSLSFKFLHFVDITEVEKIKIGPSGVRTLSIKGGKRIDKSLIYFETLSCP